MSWHYNLSDNKTSSENILRRIYNCHNVYTYPYICQPMKRYYVMYIGFEITPNYENTRSTDAVNHLHVPIGEKSTGIISSIKYSISNILRNNYPHSIVY